LTFKKFTLTTIWFVILSTLLIALTNYVRDPFGLHGSSGQERRVYIDEKTTKYLYSFNYVPNNFNGILVGSSVSDQWIDTKMIEGYKVYNMSMDGGNISELKFAIDNMFKYGGLKVLIIGLDPYITRNHGRKSSQINEKEYLSTLGSFLVFEYYVNKYIWSSKSDDLKFGDSYWGYIKNDNSTSGTLKAIDKRLNQFDSLDFVKFMNVDNIALDELSSVLEHARSENIQVLAYFHPLPKRIFNHSKYVVNYRQYRLKIDPLLDYEKDIIIDFNGDSYAYITENEKNYVDSIHLSKAGGKSVVEVLNMALGRN
jgi:hypothetical protein